MNSKARKSASARSTDCIYPDLSPSQGYPAKNQFKVITAKGGGTNIVALRDFPRISRICRISGQLLHDRGPHTLQLLLGIHLHDPFFCGLLPHSCEPNVFVDMSELWIWALMDIAKGDCLTMDYATTENRLWQQFACHCGCSCCRGWIYGYDESPNANGEQFFRHWRRRSLG
ncbi:MAG TPA: lysine methyltransferase [Pseudomonas sp.]|nr:lysine methyltransferase [Pseudomonas sp.]